MLQDFKNFAMKGNVVDLAVGVIIGAAFSKIVDSLVSDIIMPLIGAITGGLDFTNYFLRLSSTVPATVTAYGDAKKAGAVLGYGSFATAVINFMIIAFVLFIAIRQIEKLKKPGVATEPVAPPPPRSEVLLEQIRDALVNK